MSPDEFRRHGHDLIEWIARYMEGVEHYPVLARVEPGEVRAKLPPLPPEAGESFEAMMRDVDEIIMPGITHWQSPNFFAYFPANVSGPSILGELLSAALGVQGMLWATSPACTELETHVLDWLVDLMGLPESFRSSGPGGGVIQDSASSATLCALVAARHRTGPGDLKVYASTQAHSSIEKAVRIAGFGSDALRLVDVDDDFALRPDALSAAIASDVAAEATPCLVAATSGTTSSMAFDPLRPVAEICREHGAWLHVDAAMSGSAAICLEHRGFLDGLELADSYCFNPHKWLLTNFDCDCFYVGDRAALIEALNVLPEYLRNQASDTKEVIDYRDWQVPLGRRFRALKLWFVLRSYGAEELRGMIRRHVEMASSFASWVEASDDFELCAPVHLNLVCFRYRGGDEANAELLERLNSSGKLYLTHTKLNDRIVLRMSIGQARTELRHVEAAWEQIRAAAPSRRQC
ncbi:MAG: aminotransferase class V-fold PLP-dependent enzyme [Actinomycetota bacterium]|nr:aminotransferase class V-fold PLP-dependent enzyme [Actinomycetota bacterium]